METERGGGGWGGKAGGEGGEEREPGADMRASSASTSFSKVVCCFERRASSLSISTSPDIGKKASSPS